MGKFIETNVQDYFEVASVDWMLLDESIDKDGVRSHRAIRLNQRVEVWENSELYKYMKNFYVTSFSFVSYGKELLYAEDEKRGYCGFKIIAKNEFNVGEIIPGLKGIVAPCPQDIDDTPELNYSF